MCDNTNISRDQLVDLRNVHIRTDLPKKERMEDYICQIRNPHHFKIGKYEVHLRFSESAPSAQEVFSELARSKAGL